MSAPVTTPGVVTVSGTQVFMYPVPTPWPLLPGCDKVMYRQSNEGLMLAFDPINPRHLGPQFSSCYRSEVSSWWFQTADATPSFALGPTFVCPESYTAVHTTELGVDATARTQYTYCCPPSFTGSDILPVTLRRVSQCISKVPPGRTITYTTNTEVAGKSTNILTSTVVEVATATVFAPPVNGYNIVPVRREVAANSQSTRQTGGTGTTAGVSAATPSQESRAGNGTTQTQTHKQPTGMSSGAVAGAVIGLLLGLGILALVGFWLWRRRRGTAVQGRRPPELAAEVHASEVHGWGLQREAKYRYGYDGSPKTTVVVEMADGAPRHEMGGLEHYPRFELPGRNSLYNKPSR